MEENSATAVAEPEVTSATKTAPQERARPKKQPRYNVILWNDNDHSYEYVAMMMRKLFGFVLTKGLIIAAEVDTTGRAICLTTTMEHAELKRDQIHAFGRDKSIQRCQGSMWATIEPLSE